MKSIGLLPLVFLLAACGKNISGDYVLGNVATMTLSSSGEVLQKSTGFTLRSHYKVDGDKVLMNVEKGEGSLMIWTIQPDGSLVDSAGGTWTRTGS
jgi:hypothetical protein